MDDGWAQGAADAGQLPHAVALSLDKALNISAPAAAEPREVDGTGRDLYGLGETVTAMLEWSSGRQRPRTEPVRDFWSGWLDTGTALVTLATGSGKTEAFCLPIIAEGQRRVTAWAGRVSQRVRFAEPPPVIAVIELRRSVDLFTSAYKLAQHLAAYGSSLPAEDSGLSLRPAAVPPPLAMVCGIRRLTVPVVPRAPGRLAPVCQSTTRDDGRAAASAGDTKAA